MWRGRIWDSGYRRKSSYMTILQGSPFEGTLHLSMSQWRQLSAMITLYVQLTGGTERGTERSLDIIPTIPIPQIDFKSTSTYKNFPGASNILSYIAPEKRGILNCVLYVIASIPDYLFSLVNDPLIVQVRHNGKQSCRPFKACKQHFLHVLQGVWFMISITQTTKTI